MAQQPQSLDYELTVIEGGMGSGKTTTAVALGIDAKKNNKDINIFCNFPLYGIKYVLLTLGQIAELANTELLANGILIIDEAYIGGDARTSMNNFTKFLTWFTMQSRKRKLRMIVIVQHERFLDWRIRYVATEKIQCAYDSKTKIIELVITKRRGSSPKRRVRYSAPQYWKYFDTYEVPVIPDAQLAKALGSIQ
jgi:hypothetical protein